MKTPYTCCTPFLAVLTMAKEKFGIAVDAKIVQEVDELVSECDDLGASRSEIVEAILTAFVQSEADHANRVREIIIQKQKGTL
jgi:metal-responsive CopG/Arc/MetJ family transcriptional regulator